ncbi:hypothetical protein BH09MYX1_BH09MYX1_35130 [soil metagenome]
MRRLLSSLLGLAMLLVVAVAHAAPTVRDSLAADARAKFDEGSQLYKSSAFAEAREAFLAAYAKSGDPRLLFNVAVCDKSLGRYARAMSTLSRSLANPDRPLPVEYTQRATEAIATLSRYVAFVSLRSSTEGVTYLVDGEEIRENPAPLETGSHRIEARRDGYEPMNRAVDVRAGERTTLDFPLEPSRRPGVAHVACKSERPCTIRIGGEILGNAPLDIRRNPGTYVVAALVDGRTFDDRAITFENGADFDVSFSGRPSLPARLRVITNDPGDMISIDGKDAGRSGIESELPPGEHRVLVSRPGATAKTVEVLLRDNETRDVRVELEAKGGGPSPWWFVGGGVLVAGAAVSILYFVLRPTTFEGSTAGTLNPGVVAASQPGAHFP